MAEVALRLVSVGFAAMFLVAAATKVDGGREWAALARAVAPGRVAPVVRWGLPAVEAAVGVLALAAPALGLAGASVLLAAFAATIVLAGDRLRGRRCACFGGAARARIGPRLAARNAALAAVAGIATVAPAVSVALGAALLCEWARGAIAAPLRPGLRVRDPALPPGAPRLVAFLAPGCGPCERVAPALRDLTEVSVTAVLAPGPSGERQALADRLGPIARLDLERLFSRWAIPGTPFAVALDATGTVVRSEIVTTPAALTALAQAARGSAPRTSRRLLLQTAAAAGAAVAAGSVALRVESARAQAAPVVRRLTARLGQFTPDVDFDTDPRNHFSGTCLEFADRLEDTGVYDVEGNPQSRPGEPAGGYTWAAGYEPDDPTSGVPAAVCRREDKWERQWKGFCPCDGEQYTNETTCHVECPSGLLCFGVQCQTTSETYCVEARVDICLLQPRIVVSVLRWAPKGRGATKACRAMADRYNSGVGMHELQHATDTRNAVAEVGARYQNRQVRACALTDAGARSELERKIAELLQQAQQDARRAVDDATEAFHRSDAGGRGLLDCTKCQPPKKRGRRRPRR